MENEELTTFSLEDNPNDEIVEEEVIDRDEEYEDDDDYDEEEDEEEEDYDDDYGDEEEEDYDDGYNDDYYDDRLDKVLDEIAELKRGIAAPAPAVQQQQQPVYPPMPQYIYPQQPMGPASAGSEVVMYNEISRLRDELAKNQSSLEMQKELTRIKDDMARDQRFAESQYNAEIKRLQDRIDDLLKNADSSQGELPPAQQNQAAQLESGKSSNNVQSLDFDKLLSINESILRATRESDSRIQNEIAHLRSKVESMPSAEELNRVASAVKKATGSSESVNAEALEKLSNDIASIRAAIGDVKTDNNAQSAPPVIVQGGAVSGDINASELLRQLYEIRNVLGSSSTAAVNRTQVLLDLVAEYRKVNFDVRAESVSLKDKLTSVYNYVKKLEECNEPDAVDLIEATNELIEGIAAQKLDKKSYADLASYLAVNGAAVPAHVRESADKFFGICEKIESLDSLDTVVDYLPDLLAERNTLENNRHEDKVTKLVGEITTDMLEEDRDDDDIKDKLDQLTEIVVADVADLPLVEMPKNYKPAHTVSDETVFSKLAELKAAFDESIAEQKAAEEKAAQERAAAEERAEQERAAAAEEKAHAEEKKAEPEVEDPNAVTLRDVFDAVDDLRAALAQNTGSDEDTDISAMLEEVRNNYIDISERIIEVSDLINAQNESKVDEDEEEDVELITDDQKLKAIDDLDYIRGRIDEQEAFLTQISEIRSDILNISGSIDLTEQLATVTADISAQFDKLYEDLSNVIIESEANIVGKIAEPTVLIDAIEAAKLDIVAETQAVKDTLALISESVGSTAVLDAIDGIRNDLSAFADLTAANADASTADRQKLLDDVAFLREQAEAALESSQSTVVSDTVENTSVSQDNDKVYAYLDELANRIAALAAVPDDVAVTKDTLNIVADDVAVTKDAVTLVSDSVNALTENVTALTDTVRPIAEDAAAARDAATATLDALAPITDQLNVILDKLSSETEVVEAQETSAVEGEEPDPVLDDLAEVKDNLNTILDTLPLLPQSDDLITARDNTYSILDTLSMMPQSDDVVITRDNVAAVLDSVNALTESVKAIAESQQDNAALADDMAVVIDNTSAMLDSLASLAQTQESVAELRESLESGYVGTSLENDIQYIRQKLDEPTDSDTVADILQDIGLVLDKLEAFEQSFVTDKQEIIDAISGVREEVHINELDENIAATGIDDETRDILVNEISEIRERLVNIENTTNSMGDVNSTALDNINVQLADIQNALTSTPADSAATATETVDNDAINAIFAELSDIKDRLEGGVTVMSAENGDTAVSGVTDESLQAIADELAIIREKIDTESEYDTIEEILSLREDVKAARIVDQNDVSGELESIKNELAAISSGNILDEIRALREELASVSVGGEDATTPTNDELNLVLNEIVSLRDEMFAFKDEVLSATAAQDVAETEAEANVADDDVTTILDELTALRADQTALTGNIDELKDIISRRTTISADATEQEAVTAASNELNVVLGEIIDIKNNIERVEENLPTDRLDSLTEQVEQIRALIDEMRASTVETSETSTVAEENSIQSGIADDIAELRAEIELLRSENEVLRRENADMVTNGLNELRDAIHDMALTVTPATSSDGETSYAALIDEIRSLKAEVAESKAATQPVGLDEETIRSLKDALSIQSETVTPLAEELSDIRDEIAQLRSLTTVTAENSGAVEIAAIKEELEQIKSAMTTPTEDFGNIAEDVTSIKADVRAIKDEPDLGVLNEILALRDEFQKLREEIEDVKEIASKTDEESDGAILNEVQSLRDQLFAISMANVNDSASGESNYESYNNIILDEIASLREQAANAGSEEELKAVTAEIQDIKAALEKREDLYDALSKRVEKLDNDATNNKILEELESLRTEIANQRDADLTTLNFMSEMAHLLERQNNYISQNTGTKISDEIESLKAEIASTDAVAEEIAKLREIMTRSGNASDNDTILNELAGLREELSAEKPSKENELILEEIARLRDELMTLKANEQVQDHTDSDLKDTLSDLKDQLNEIAEIVEPAEAPEKPAAKKPAAKKPAAKRGRPAKSGTSAKKPAAKKPAAKRTTNKAATPTSTVTEQPEEVIAIDNQPQVERDDVDFDIKLGDEIAKLTNDGDDMSLNPQGPISSDSMDVADKLAKQVANKLVMEQLVEQLGDGGVSDERVDEILRDILPQEFTTVALNEQSDKVRKLANRLVLNKLRDRLGGRKLDTDDNDDDDNN